LTLERLSRLEHGNEQYSTRVLESRSEKAPDFATSSLIMKNEVVYRLDGNVDEKVMIGLQIEHLLYSVKVENDWC
jgi:hypothetical protein